MIFCTLCILNILSYTKMNTFLEAILMEIKTYIWISDLKCWKILTATWHIGCAGWVKIKVKSKLYNSILLKWPLDQTINKCYKSLLLGNINYKNLQYFDLVEPFSNNIQWKQKYTCNRRHETIVILLGEEQR